MNNDSITYNKAGNAIAFNGPDAVHCYRAAVLASAIGLLQKGITPHRGMSMRKALAMATQYTGKHYKRTESDQARADLSVWVQTMKAALPHDEVQS